ncbi:peroxin-24 Pex24-Penicillium chrysogenum [Penicillium chrysogenum]|nr:peroxin-24 Pex24-Penicillium chrysogenum [Penicillium chrysogenum]
MDGFTEALNEKVPTKRNRPGSPDSSHSRSSSLSKNSLQDRLFTKVLQQVIPDDEDEADSLGDKAFASPKKPAFSLPVMANNFRRFNARIGVVFLFQSRVEQLFTWDTPTHTISFLFVYSFICLEPHLLLVLPLVVLLLFIMVPAFATRHPPPPNTSTSSTTPYYSYDGPALAPARTIKPAPETSKDFLRNMRDLQNCMADFSDAHDAAISVIAPLTNFSNEKLSSTLFLGCTIAIVVLFISAHLLPLKIVMLVGGNALVLSIHPTVGQFLSGLMQDMTGDSIDTDSDDNDGLTSSVPADPSAAMSAMEKLADISLDTYPEEREVEIFELQHRAVGTSESGWESFLFSHAPYDPLSPSRIAGDRPRGCRFFEDVRAPRGWAWKSKNVGFEVPGVNAEGNAIVGEVGGWVWDLPQTRQESDDDLTLAYGDLPETQSPKKSKSKEKEKEKEKAKSRDWEEGNASYGVGEWRRRRWVRVVQRISLPPQGVVTYSTLSSNT